MVKRNKEFDDMIDPVDLDEPENRKDRGDDGSSFEVPEGLWMRGLMMLILALLFALAETILGVVAVVQFVWMMFTKEKNGLLMDFGHDLGEWMGAVARFQSGASEDKPFPWAKWG